MDDYYDGDGPHPGDECDGCGNPLAYCDCDLDEFDADICTDCDGRGKTIEGRCCPMCEGTGRDLL